MDQGRPSHVVASTSKSTPVRPPSSKPEPQSSITRDPIGGRSFSAALTWWLFRALVPLFIPPAVHLRGPEIFPFPPPIPATCEAEQWKENSTGWTITAVRSRNQPKAGASRLIILFHGGAFSHPIGPSHWRIAARFAEDLDAEVHVIPTPLAPENRAAEVRGDIDALLIALKLTPRGCFAMNVGSSEVCDGLRIYSSTCQWT